MAWQAAHASALPPPWAATLAEGAAVASFVAAQRRLRHHGRDKLLKEGGARSSQVRLTSDSCCEFLKYSC